MKNRTRLYTLIGCAVLAGAAIASCSLLSGCANTVPPTKAERIIFDTFTNYVVVTHTNEVVVPVLVTNVTVLTITNQQNQTITTFSNWVVKTFETNQVAAPPTLEPRYALAPKPAVVQTAGAASSLLPGPWALGIQGALALLAAWGHWRSRQKGTTATTLVQELAVVRQFMQALPNGAAYDEAVVSFLRAHQNEVGVASQVVNILAANVSNPDVVAGAQGLVDYVNSLESVTVTLPPISASPTAT